MKYKDFKKLTPIEMTKIIGGNFPEDGATCGTCPSSSGGNVKLTCKKDTFNFCIKPANCNNAVDCKEEA